MIYFHPVHFKTGIPRFLRPPKRRIRGRHAYLPSRRHLRRNRFVHSRRHLSRPRPNGDFPFGGIDKTSSLAKNEGAWFVSERIIRSLVCRFDDKARIIPSMLPSAQALTVSGKVYALFDFSCHRINQDDSVHVFQEED